MGESRNMIAGLYDLEETIGEGHYAVVKLARYNNMIWIWTQLHVLCSRHVFTGEKVAVKVIDKLKLDQATRMQMLQVMIKILYLNPPTNQINLPQLIRSHKNR